MAKEAKFFCENCGAEVPKSARLCKKCGRFFSAVRCPVCGRTGSSNMFKDGCPSCGYAGKSSPGIAAASSIKELREKNAREKGHFFVRDKQKKRTRFHSSEPQSDNSTRRREDGVLPAWIYIVTISALFALVFIMVMCDFNS